MFKITVKTGTNKAQLERMELIGSMVSSLKIFYQTMTFPNIQKQVPKTDQKVISIGELSFREIKATALKKLNDFEKS